MMLNENALSQLTTISAILTLTLQAGNTVESDVGKNGRSRNGSFVVKGVTSYWAYEKERKIEFFFSRLLKLEQVIHTKKTSDNNIPFMKKYQSLGSDRRTLSVQQLAKFLTRRNEESGWLHGVYRNPVRLKHKQVMWNMHGDEVSLFKIQRTRRFFKQKSSFKSFRRKLLFAEDNSVKSADKRLEISGSSGSEKDRNISVTVFSSFEDMGGTTEISKNMTSEEYEEEVFRIRHRLRNNEDAMWGLACVSFILVLLVWGVWFSGMCKGSRDTLVYAEYSTSIQSMSVREMLKNRAKFLPIFRRFRRKKKQDDEIPLIDDVMAADSDDDKLFERGWESMELPS